LAAPTFSPHLPSWASQRQRVDLPLGPHFVGASSRTLKLSLRQASAYAVSPDLSRFQVKHTINPFSRFIDACLIASLPALAIASRAAMDARSNQGEAAK